VDQNPEVARVLEVLTARRLVTVSEGTAEVAHEALLREWPRFVQWMEEDREGRRLHAHLAVTAREWSERGQDTAELYRGARLSSALDWTTEHTLELNELEREFVNASRVENERELIDQRRRNRRLRVLLAGTAALLALAVVAGVIALVSRSHAQHEATVALARQLGAAAVIEPRLDRAMLLARESVNLDSSQATNGTLLATLLRNPAAIGTFTVPITDRPQRVEVAPGGQTIAAVMNEDLMRFYDTLTHRQIHAMPFANAAFMYLNGTHDLFAAAAGATPAYELVDTHTYRMLRSFRLDHRWTVVPTSFSEPIAVTPNHRYFTLAYAVINKDGSDGLAYLDRWSIDQGGKPTTFPLGVRGMVADVITADGRLVVASDSGVSTWNAYTMRKIRSVSVRGLRPRAFLNGALSPDGRLLAYGLADGTVHFVDTSTGKETAGLTAHAAAVQGVAFSPDSQIVVTGGDDGLVIVWNPHTGQPLDRLTGHAGRVLGSVFSADGRTVYAASLDGTILQWDLGRGRRFGDSFTVGAQSPSVDLGRGYPPGPPLSIAPDGRSLAALDTPSSVGLYSTSSLRRTISIALGHARYVGAVAWAGSDLVVGDDSGTVGVYSTVPKPKLVRRLRGLERHVRSVAAADGGTLVAAVDGSLSPPSFKPSGSLAIWHAGKLVAKPVVLHAFGNSVAFSPDGSLLAVAVDDGRVLIVDPRSGRVERTIRPLSGSITVSFSPGGTLANGASGGIFSRWDAHGGRQIGRQTLVAAAPVASIAFDPTGQTFVTTGGSSGLAKLWSTATQQQLGADFPGGQGQWGNAAFTPDGRYLFVVFGDGSAYRWPATPAAWAQHACAVAGRNFTREEWSRYVSGRAYSKTCG